MNQKTQYKAIQERHKRTHFDQDVYLSGHVVCRVSSVEFQGLYSIDKHLSFARQNEYCVRVLSKFRSLLTERSHSFIYNSYLYPILV